MARTRDPMPAFWSFLTERYLLAARLLYLQSSVRLDDADEDLVQATLAKTARFVEKRQNDLGEEFRLTEFFIDECLKHGRTCMENLFIDRIRAKKAELKSRRIVKIDEPVFLSIPDMTMATDERAVCLRARFGR